MRVVHLPLLLLAGFPAVTAGQLHPTFSLLVGRRHLTQFVNDPDLPVHPIPSNHASLLGEVRLVVTPWFSPSVTAGSSVGADLSFRTVDIGVTVTPSPNHRLRPSVHLGLAGMAAEQISPSCPELSLYVRPDPCPTATVHRLGFELRGAVELVQAGPLTVGAGASWVQSMEQDVSTAPYSHFTAFTIGLLVGTH